MHIHQDISTDANDVLRLINDKNQHMQKLIDILKSESTEVIKKQEVLPQFIDLIINQALAKEATIYSILKNINESEQMTYEALEEQAVALILIEELEQLNYQTSWTKKIDQKAKILARIIEHYILDEEANYFNLARKVLTKEELYIIGEEYQLRFQILG